MTSHYAFSPAYQGLYFDYTKEKTLSTLVNLRMFWRIKINCYRLNTWGVSQMEINIALLEHRRQAWNWKATWILNHFRFPKPFYFKEHDLSKQNFPIPSFSRSLKYIVLFHSKMSLQWGRLKEQRRSCVTQPNGAEGKSPAVPAQGVSVTGSPPQKAGVPHSSATSAAEGCCILDLRAWMSKIKITQSQPSTNGQKDEQMPPTPLQLRGSEACALCLEQFPEFLCDITLQLSLSVCALGDSYSLITFLCPFQWSL